MNKNERVKGQDTYNNHAATSSKYWESSNEKSNLKTIEHKKYKKESSESSDNKE